MGGSPTPPWYDAAFGQRVELTSVNSSGEAQQGFPVLVLLTGARIDYSSTALAGADLRFVADDQTTTLPHEIEEWNAKGTSAVWVRLPEFPVGETAFWIYYSNASAADAQEPAAVWSNAYAAVWHLDPSLGDASGGSHTGTNNNSKDVPAVVARGRSFNGAGHAVKIVQISSLDGLFDTGATVEAWIRPQSFGGNEHGRIIEKSEGIDIKNGWSLLVDNVTVPATLTFGRGHTTTAARWSAPAKSVVLDSWLHAAVTYVDGGTAKLFIDGIEKSVRSTAPDGGISKDTATKMRIGNRTDSSRGFEGDIDEVRLSTVQRSAAWIALQYQSMTDGLITYGPAESL